MCGIGTSGGVLTNLQRCDIYDQYEKVQKFVKVALDEGATLVCGGKRPDVSLLAS